MSTVLSTVASAKVKALALAEVLAKARRALREESFPLFHLLMSF
jgi:hypothetical protein